MENAKEYLQQYHDACLRAERIRHEYERESELIDSIRSPQGSDGLPHGQSFGSQVEAKVMKLVTKLEELKDAEIEALQIRREIFDTIKELPGLMSEVLFERYINFKTWDDVATSCFISKRKAFMIHNEALAKLCNK